MNLSVSSSIDENIEKTVEIANKLNVGIEVCKFADPNILDNDYEELLKSFETALRNLEGFVSLHGTFFDLNPSSKDQRILDVTEYRYNQSFNIAKRLGAKTVVFHTGYNGLVKFPIYHEKFIESHIIFWGKFIKNFENEGIVAVLENTYEDTPEVIKTVIEHVASNNLKACIDTGHVNINSTEPIAHWIKIFGKDLHHMHLHNNYGKCDEHKALTDGTINFNQVIEALNRNNLTPNLTIEIFKGEPALESVNYLKKVLNTINMGV